MTEIVDFPIYESQVYSLFFELEYSWVRASGNDRNEPHEPAHWEMQSTKLYSISRRLVDTGKIGDERFQWEPTKTYHPEPIPRWLTPILDNIDPLDYLDDPRD